MSRRPRGLRPDERELWQRVAATARPLHPERPSLPEAIKIGAQPPKARLPDFQIASATRHFPEKHDFAGTVADRLAGQHLRMDQRTHQRMRRGKFEPEARIDLHGMTIAEAHPALIRFVLASHAAGRRLVLVITGKGKQGQDAGPIPQRVGVLRHQVPIWLGHLPLGSVILQVTQSHVKHGGVGAFYVYLRRTRQR